MMLLAMTQWIGNDVRGIVSIVGDAEGVLGALTRMRSDDGVINAMAMEIALWLAPKGLALEGLHIWGEQNSAADQLSRLSQGAAVPVSLRGVTRDRMVPRASGAWTFLGKL
jgi:hypothetical protein